MKQLMQACVAPILGTTFLLSVFSEVALGQSTTPAMQPVITPVASYAAPKNVYVSSVRCIRPTTGSKQDQIRLEAYDTSGSGKLRNYSRTYKMKAGDVLGIVFSTNLKAGSIALMEQDSFSADDKIGSFKFNKNILAGRYIKRFDGDGGVYEVTIEIRPYHSVEDGGMGKVLN